MLKGNVEGLILWDITPAGDRVRRGLPFISRPALRRSAFAHQAGLILRSARAAGSVETFCEEKCRKRGMDRPRRSALARRARRSSLTAGCPSKRDAGRRRQVARGPATLGRLDSRISSPGPIGVERYSGSLGVRRPGDWTGRFDPLPDTDPIS